MPLHTWRRWSQQPNFAYLLDLFSAQECETIVSYHADVQLNRSELDYGDDKVRDSDLYWLTYAYQKYHWIFQRLEEAVFTWNSENLGFEIEECSDLQLTCYGVGQHYDWHADLGGAEMSRRKLSVAVLLSDLDDFEGGHLEFFGTDVRRPRAEPRRGDGVIFPSWMKHRVVPVTEGARWSLVCWWGGPPFR